MIQCFARTVCMPNSLFTIPNSLFSLLGTLDFSKANYRVLLRNGLPLLLIPPDRDAASLTLGMYLPQGRKAKLAVVALKTANELGLLSRILPKLVSSSSGACATAEPMPFSQDDIDRGLVGFLLCNPDHGCARVVAVRAGSVPPCHACSASVFKWTDLAGKEKLKSELDKIKLLTQRGSLGVPEFLSEGTNSFSSWFEMEHYAKTDVVSTGDPRVITLLRSWISDECISPLENKLGALLWATEKWTPSQGELERLAALKTRKAVVHGDFAPWNLRTRLGKLIAIDWEWAEPDGIAGVDLGYGLLQEALLVKKLPPRQALHYVRDAADLPDCREYLETAGWRGAIDLWIKTAVLYRNSRKLCPELLAILCDV